MHLGERWQGASVMGMEMQTQLPIIKQYLDHQWGMHTSVAS